MEKSGSAIVSLEKEQIDILKKEAARGRNYSERISIALALRLLSMPGQGMSSFAVLDEIEYLEGFKTVSRTKPESQFRARPLHPFWHKHFFEPRHMVRNIAIRWGLDGGGNKDLERRISEVARSHGEKVDVWPAVLAQQIFVAGYEERFKRGLTGDWLVFAKHNEKNYYLDLATHEEGKGENADGLYKKLKQGCAVDFPFLFEDSNREALS